MQKPQRPKKPAADAAKPVINDDALRAFVQGFYGTNSADPSSFTIAAPTQPASNSDATRAFIDSFYSISAPPAVPIAEQDPRSFLLTEVDAMTVQSGVATEFRSAMDYALNSQKPAPQPRFDPSVFPPGMQARFEQRRGGPLADGIDVHKSTHSRRKDLIFVAKKESIEWNRDPRGALAPEHNYDPLSRTARLLVDKTPKEGHWLADLITSVDNVNKKLTDNEVAYLTELYSHKYNRANAGDFTRALLSAGFFNDATYFDGDDILTSDARISRYISVDFNLFKLCALYRLYVFVLDLNNDAVLADIREALREALVRFLRTTASGMGALEYVRLNAQHNGKRMAIYQDVNNPSRDGFFFRDTNECLLLTLYNHPKVINSGSYGLVLAYRDIAAKDLRAVKLQRLDKLDDTNEEAYTELRIMYEIQQLAKHWSDKRAQGPCNFVRLYDWVRCQLDARDVYKSILSQMDERDKRHVSPGKGMYQIIVQQLAPDGDLNDAIFSSEASVKRFFERKTFAAVAGQVLRHIFALSSVLRYSHCDLKPANCVLERQSAFSPYRYVYLFFNLFNSNGRLTANSLNSYLVYPKLSQIGEMYIPLVDCFNLVVKVADQGLALVSISVKGSDTIREEVPQKHSNGWQFNPAHDVESFALTIIEKLLDECGTAKRPQDELIESVPVEILRFLKSSIHSDPFLSLLPEAILSDYTAVNECLEGIIQRKDSDYWRDAPKRKAASKAAGRLYRRHSPAIWARPATAEEQDALANALRDPIFSHLSEKPQNLIANNSIVMTDYKVATP